MIPRGWTSCFATAMKHVPSMSVLSSIVRVFGGGAAPNGLPRKKCSIHSNCWLLPAVASTMQAMAETACLVSVYRSPFPPFLGNAIHGTAGFFASGWPLAYLVATVIFSIGLLVGAVVHVSEPVQLAEQSVPLPSPLSPVPSVVARITGMADCKFEGRSGFRVRGQGLKIRDRKSEIRNPSSPSATSWPSPPVCWKSPTTPGPRSSFQGPVTYEVESPAGGFLSIGKLTARVEKKAQSNLQIPNPKSPNSLSTLPPPP